MRAPVSFWLYYEGAGVIFSVLQDIEGGGWGVSGGVSGGGVRGGISDTPPHMQYIYFCRAAVVAVYLQYLQYNTCSICISIKVRVMMLMHYNACISCSVTQYNNSVNPT